MNNILTDDKSGQQYMLSPSSQELERGIIQYIPELHAHLWSYIMIDGQLYSIHPDLIDWDQGVDERGHYGTVAIWHPTYSRSKASGRGIRLSGSPRLLSGV